MRETITMTSTEQQRCIVLTKLLVGELSLAEAASLMKVSDHHVLDRPRRETVPL
jgi:hypothetical protein